MARARLLLALLAAAPLAACPEPAGQHAAPPQGPALPSATPGPAGVDALSLRRPAGPEWFGLYLMGKKAGWTRVELRRQPRDGREVVVAASETLLEATVGDKTVSRRLSEERIYEARPAGRLLAFRAEWSGDGGDRTVTGRCSPSGCTARVSSDGAARDQDLGAVVETLDQAEGVRLAAARRATVLGPQLDLEKLRVRELEQRYLGRERVAGAGVEAEVSVVSEAEVGDRIAAEYRVADDGRVVEIRIGGSIVARPEPEATARKLEAIDLFTLSRVPLPGPLPRTVPATVTYRLSGLPAGFRKPDARQTFAPGPGGTTLLTVRARLPAAVDPQRDTPRTTPSPDPELVAATPVVDADHPAVAKLARDLAGDVPGRYAAALRLSEHVNRRLEKAYGASKDRASDVLAAGKGDCTEHAVLFVALARALGIPARQVHGLVYARYADGKDALYWHAWAELLSGGEWIALDPTFGQPVADATHLALGIGTQVDTVGLLGALQVDAVDVKHEK
ncbi:MAG: lasso peptide biosynthesis protein [Anaeromyxobacter sp.]|nr:lasso peptide biosynthesis protein [Anaeromyxobacter sp.]MBL0277121.1 lasso peptide biosynthesis protein [Anaeromyxobacter sp.]